MTVARIVYNWNAHANTAAAYEAALDGLCDAIDTASAWSKTYVGRYIGTLAVLTVLTHPSGAQLAFVVTGGSDPIVGANNVAGVLGTRHVLYMAFRPSDSDGDPFDTGSDPYSDVNWISDAGAFRFHNVSPLATDLYLANRKFIIVRDVANPWFFMENQDTPATPPAKANPSGFHFVFDSDTHLFVPSSIKDSHNAIQLSWIDNGLEFSNLRHAQCFDENNERLTLKATGSTGEGVFSIDPDVIGATYNNAQPWYDAHVKLAIKPDFNRHGYIKGVFDPTYLTMIGSGLTAGNKVTLNSGDLLYYSGNICGYYESGWTVE